VVAGTDPIFAAMEAHRAIRAAMKEAGEARSEAERAIGEPEWPNGWALMPEYAERWDADANLQAAIDRGAEAIEAEEAAFRGLTAVKPTTPEGLLAFARYGCELEEEENGAVCTAACPAHRFLAAIAGIPEGNGPEDEA
jgi:hypothetical protein